MQRVFSRVGVASVLSFVSTKVVGIFVTRLLALTAWTFLASALMVPSPVLAATLSDTGAGSASNYMGGNCYQKSYSASTAPKSIGVYVNCTNSGTPVGDGNAFAFYNSSWGNVKYCSGVVPGQTVTGGVTTKVWVNCSSNDNISGNIGPTSTIQVVGGSACKWRLSGDTVSGHAWCPSSSSELWSNDFAMELNSTAFALSVCGDNMCNGTETPTSCSADCGPVAPTTIVQKKADSSSLAEGGITNYTSAIFGATPSSPAGGSLRIQAQVLPATVAFTSDETTGVANSGFVTSGTAVTVSSGALTDGAWHWRIRSVDQADNKSGWVEYGQTGNTDFTIQLLPSLSGLGQAGAPSGTAISSGSDISETDVTLAAVVASPAGYPARMEVELKSIFSAFDGSGTVTSGLFSPGQTATVAGTGLATGPYHWRARAIDSRGLIAPWQLYGGSSYDFAVRSFGERMEYEQSSDGTGQCGYGCQVESHGNWQNVSPGVQWLGASSDMPTRIIMYLGSAAIGNAVIRTCAMFNDGIHGDDYACGDFSSVGQTSPSITLDFGRLTVGANPAGLRSMATLKRFTLFRELLSGTEPSWMRVIGHRGFDAFGSMDALWNTNELFTSKFQIYGRPNGVSLSSVSQSRYVEQAALVEGAMVPDSDAVLSGTVSGPVGSILAMQFEYKPVTLAFNGQNLVQTATVASGEVASHHLVEAADGAYHWRARAVDSLGNASAWQEFGQAGNTDFVVRNPVIIVPGIMGSELSDSTEKVWFDIFHLRSHNLGLNADGSSLEESLFASAVIKVDPFNNDVHQGLEQELEDDGYVDEQSMFFFPYDWRMDNTVTAELLAASIAGVSASRGSSKVDIIAHSMGGLVVKKYIAISGPESEDNKIGKLIFVGTPHLGAPKIAAIMKGGTISSNDLTLNSAFLARPAIASMPSAYQITPSGSYISLVGSYMSRTVANSAEMQPLDDTESGVALLSSGADINLLQSGGTWLDDNFVATLSGLDTYNFVGIGSDNTVSNLRLKSNNILKGVDFGPGDGTVPRASADAVYVPEGHRYFVPNVTHSELPSADGVRQAIASILGSQTVSTADGKLIADENSCSDVEAPRKWILVGMHSPATIVATDSNGNTTGTGVAVEASEIPGAVYYEIGEEKFLRLPDGDGQQYTLTGQGTDTGTFDLVVSKSDAGDIESTAVYNRVSVSPEAGFTLDLSPASLGGQLELTVGTGAPQAVEATVVLDGAAAADEIAPVTVATLSGTTGLDSWYAGSATVTLTSSDDSAGILDTFYSVDGGASYSLYAGPVTVTTDGETDFRYYSTDRAENEEEPLALDFKVDATNPIVQVTSPCDGLNVEPGYVSVTAVATDARSGVVSVSVNGVGCVLSEGTWLCTDVPVAEGNNTLVATTVDGVGHSTTASVVVRGGTQTASFSFTSSHGTLFECQIDGGPWSPCPASMDYSSLADGNHVFSSRWVIDTHPPVLELATLAGLDPYPATVTMAGTAGDGDGTGVVSVAANGSACTLDGGAWSCDVALDPSVPTLITVTAADFVGNTTTATLTLSPPTALDTVPPLTTATLAGTEGTNGWYTSDVVLTLSAADNEGGSGVAYVEFSLNGGANWTAYEAPATIAGDGEHEVLYRSADAASNVESAKTLTVSIDATAPDALIDLAPVTLSGWTTATLAFHASEENATFECRLDGGQWAGCTSQAVLSDLSDGAHEFAVRATDPAGNISLTPSTVAWTVDILPPDTVIDFGPPATTASTDAEFSFHATEEVMTFWCRLDGGVWTPCESPSEHGPLEIGSHIFEVRAEDLVGNFDATPAQSSWTVTQ